MPTANDAGQSKTDAKDLLLEDCRYLSESFWKNEQTGETRVNWFIGIVTAVGAGLVGLISSEHRPHGESLRFIIIASLFALLVFGVTTLFRIMKRNETTDGYKHKADTVREMFKDHLDDDHVLLQYHPFGKRTTGKSFGKKGTSDIARKFGGLAHTVLTINSLILAGLAAVAVYPVHAVPGKALYLDDPMLLSWTYLAAAFAFCLAAAGQFFFIKRADKKAKKRLFKDAPTHAGGIVYQIENGATRYLLVGPKKDVPNEWLLPKGHIDKGEDHWEAAVREVREETGVLGRIICLVGSTEFHEDQERAIAKYYLMEYFFKVRPEESRRVQWFGFDQAMDLLTHVSNKHLLQEAERKRRARL